MKFLQKLGFLGLVVGLMAAKSDPSGPGPGPGDEKSAAKTLAEIQAKCGPRIWENNELLGMYGNDPIVTKIVENRIYITKSGVYEANRAVLYHLSNDRFPIETSKYVETQCVNPADPITSGLNYLGAATNDQVICNGKTVKKNTWQSYFLGGDGVRTYNVIKINNKIMTVQAVRKSDRLPINQDDLNQVTTSGFNSSLMREAIEQGHTNPDLGYPALTVKEIEGCIYKDTPLNPEYIVNSCASNPVVGTISSVTSSGLSFSFTGSGITSLNWSITATGGSSSVASGTASNVNTAGVAISYGKQLSAGSYTLKISAGNCTSSESSKTFEITKPNCASTPTISTIKNITGTSLTVDFTGTNTPNTLTWTIKNSSNTSVATNKTGTLTGGTANLTFAYLANGNYTLEIQGGDCVSTPNSRAFVINVADSRPPCKTGPELKSIVTAAPTTLTFNYFGEEIYSVDWRILNSAGSSVATSTQSIVPVNDRPIITYNNLPDGNYQLEIQGGNTCKSTPSALAFKIGNALPIYISNFKAEVKKEGVNLAWTVVSEKNGEGFQVLRYDDKVKTAKILASIPLTESKIGNYNFLDENPANGVNYYQLKQIDKDGSFTNSRIVSAKYEQLYGVILAPNPAKDYIDVNFESRTDGTANLETYNVSGVRVLNSQQKVKIGNNRVRINVSGLSDGSYVLKIDNSDQAKSLRFMKVR
jgi:methionine-rich copper-binding protein CopC